MLISKIALLNKVTKTWPAIMLIDNRKNKVKGRIVKLINSIRTIIGAKILGVLKGTKWERKLFFFLVKLINSKGNHNMKIKGRLKEACLVNLKLKKFNLNMLAIKTIKKVDLVKYLGLIIL